MEDLNLTIHFEETKTKPATAPPGFPTAKFLQDLLGALGLPTDVHWGIRDEDIDKTLDHKKSLEENGVRDGHRLRLYDSARHRELQAALEQLKEKEAQLLRATEDQARLQQRLTQSEARAESLDRDLALRSEEIQRLRRQADDMDRELVAKRAELQTLEQLLKEKGAGVQPVAPGVPIPRLVVRAFPVTWEKVQISLEEGERALDLGPTHLHIPATLERNLDGTISLLVHPGATLHIQRPGSTKWETFSGGARVSAEPGLVLSGDKGTTKALLDNPR